MKSSDVQREIERMTESRKMNKRIRELAKDSDLIRYDSDGNIPRVEKFAELIVRECADVSKNYASGSLPLSIAMAIKQHFGVEE